MSSVMGDKHESNIRDKID